MTPDEIQVAIILVWAVVSAGLFYHMCKGPDA